MFTGIIKEVAPIVECFFENGVLRYGVAFSQKMLEGLVLGASVSIDGACQTVVAISKNLVYFDAISETLSRTTLDTITLHRLVNIERAARFGDEIGGHLLSGHVMGKAKISRIEREGNSAKFFFEGNTSWMKYLFSKGFIAIDGASLTLIDVDLEKNSFSVQLIPETLKTTTFGQKKAGDLVNIEIDAQTQALVETTIRLLNKKNSL